MTWLLSNNTFEDIQRFSNRFFFVATSSSLDSKSRGMLVVLKRKLPFNIVERYSFEEGRVSYIKTVIVGRNFAFISIYAPSHFDQYGYKDMPFI